MNKMREKHIKEIENIKNIILKTENKYIKKDYEKSLKRMINELNEYDRLYNKGEYK